jgi:hypothetical protein
MEIIIQLNRSKDFNDGNIRMQNMSEYVVNIVPLQNINTNISGTNTTTALSNAVVGLQQMINTDTKTVKADFIQSFTANSNINILSPLNLSNADILSNTAVGAFTVDGPLTVSGSGTFSGICYAQQFVTLSDILTKSSVTKWTGSALDGINQIHPYRFSYTDSRSPPSSTVGLLAQEVGSLWPELIQIGVKGKYVNYDGVVSILVKAVQELVGRISTLESATVGKHS